MVAYSPGTLPSVEVHGVIKAAYLFVKYLGLVKRRVFCNLLICLTYSFFLGFIEGTNTIQVLIESFGFPFARLTCCGFQHEGLHSIENDNEVVIPKLRSLAH
jgi:hypothetical protein